MAIEDKLADKVVEAANAYRRGVIRRGERRLFWNAFVKQLLEMGELDVAVITATLPSKK